MSLSSRKKTKPERGTRTRQQERVAEQITRLAREKQAGEPDWLIEHFVQQGLRVLELEQQKIEQARQIEAQAAEIEELKEKLAQAERAGKRQAAPFRRSKRKTQPKRPGRKAGHRGHWRQPPAASAADEHYEMPLETCPDCGQLLDKEHQQAIEQIVIDVPPVEPRVIRLKTYRNHCQNCQKNVRSQHPLQVSRATGAAGTQIGPRALGYAAYLNKQLGVMMRKTVQALETMTGVRLSPGGLSQALDRIAERLQPRYDNLLAQLRDSEVLYCDETGWWVSGPGYWLWILTNKHGTYYRVVASRSKPAARELIGQDFDGVLVSDCLNIYDDLTPRQHKCYAHHFKAISQAQQTPAGQSSSYLLELRAWLHAALLLKRLSCEPNSSRLSALTLAQLRRRLEERIETLLTPPRAGPETTDPQAQLEESLRQRLAKQRDHLLVFLDVPQVDATNNRAERQLRPAVIARKVSCGNKTESGARTWEILASLAATAAQSDESFVELVAQVVPT